MFFSPDWGSPQIYVLYVSIELHLFSLRWLVCYVDYQLGGWRSHSSLLIGETQSLEIEYTRTPEFGKEGLSLPQVRAF
jgi:hypothetical protein